MVVPSAPAGGWLQQKTLAGGAGEGQGGNGCLAVQAVVGQGCSEQVQEVAITIQPPLSCGHCGKKKHALLCTAAPYQIHTPIARWPRSTHIFRQPVRSLLDTQFRLVVLAHTVCKHISCAIIIPVALRTPMAQVYTTSAGITIFAGHPASDTCRRYGVGF